MVIKIGTNWPEKQQAVCEEKRLSSSNSHGDHGILIKEDEAYRSKHEWRKLLAPIPFLLCWLPCPSLSHLSLVPHSTYHSYRIWGSALLFEELQCEGVSRCEEGVEEEPKVLLEAAEQLSK